MEKTITDKHICAGILAHVDAGKTTLSEGLLYLCGEIRRLGRVDHGDAFLDTYELEKERGITIFSKQAILRTGQMEVTLLDTPGHVDFSAEMERTLQVLDYAVLVISGMDGVQSHTMTLWKLLERYQIPVFLFINKMDQEGTDRENLLEELKKRLDGNCINFSSDTDQEVWMENVAVCDEKLMEAYLETGTVDEARVAALIAGRKIFPCYFGSALKMQGVEELLKGLGTYTREKRYPGTFGAKVFKIARDAQGNRLTYLKVTGGSLKVKTVLSNTAGGDKKPQALPGYRQTETGWEEKVDQIRLYSGEKYEVLQEAAAGTVCAVTGLTKTRPGQGLGMEEDCDMPGLEPVLTYPIQLPEGWDPHKMLQQLRQLEEEEPELHIVWDSALGEIHAQIMGEVQIEILKRQIWERFHVAVEFGTGSIVYKETIAAPVVGIGHFEPLRHYAEVQLLLEPGEPGSGCQFFTACSEDVLARNWQRLILTHLEEKEHRGVLTGSALTDIQITLLAGRAHAKHTEGGDFRQATYRAVRQGLKKAKNILLEPYYEFCLELPAEMIGRAMSDIQKMQGDFLPPETDGETAVLCGTASVAEMRDYQKEVVSYTRGTGRLFCSLKGYAPCRNQEKIVEEIGYDSERDLENPTGSVFCAHGAGFVVPWDQVEEYMHLNMEIDEDELEAGESWYEDMEDGGREQKDAEEDYMNSTGKRSGGSKGKKSSGSYSYSGSYEDEKELQAIFERTFGPVKRDRGSFQKKTVHAPSEPRRYRPAKPKKEEYLLVDGYNIVFAWEELRELAEKSIHAACDKLKDILSNYQGYRQCTLILVFDAYKVEGHEEEVIPYHNIYVVYTKEAETADQYIEKTVHRIGREHQVTVATSDGLEQVIILGQGAHRLSAQGLKKEIQDAEKAGKQEWRQRRQSSRNYLFDSVDEETAEYMEKIRLGKQSPEK